MNLSAHFTLAEFCTSQTAARMGHVIEPTESDTRNLTRLCIDVLEPLRIDLRRVMVVSSGLRPLWLNKAIGGSRTSAHMTGCAADIQVPGMSPIEVCKRVKELELPVDQCIYEFGQWTHLGIAPAGIRNRKEFLTARVINGTTHYEQGINV